MKNRPLAQGTRVHVGSILITEKFGNMQVAAAREPSNVITVERADVDDFTAAFNRHLGLTTLFGHLSAAEGVSTRVGSILVANTADGLRIFTTHTPSNAIAIERAAVDDLRAALREAREHLV